MSDEITVGALINILACNRLPSNGLPSKVVFDGNVLSTVQYNILSYAERICLLFHL